MIDEITITSLSGRGSITMTYGDRYGYWLNDVDWGQVEGQHQTYAYYNQVGSSIVSTTIGTRDISIEGFVVEQANTLRDRCDKLNTFFSPAEDYNLACGDKMISFRPDSSVAYSREFLYNNKKARRFLIQGTAPYPLFTGTENNEAVFSSLIKLFHFPTDFGVTNPVVFGAADRASNIQINNTGGFATGMIIRVSFSGSVVNPKVRNVTTGKFIGVNRTFQNGEALEFCTIPGQKRMTLKTDMGETVNILKYRDFRTSWLTLEPGINNISLDCDDLEQRGNMTAEINYTPLYLEVE